MCVPVNRESPTTMETEMVSPPPPPSPDRWCVERSDEEGEEGGNEEGGEGEGEAGALHSDGPWTPSPQEILRLYLALASGEGLSLSAPPLLRRPLTPEEGPSTEEAMEEAAEDQEEDEEKPPTPTEFDFDDEPTPAKSFLGMRRSAGSASRPQPRAARLDKVLSDMERHRRIDEQMMRSGRDHFERGVERALQRVSPPGAAPAQAGRPPSPSRARGVFQRRNY